MPSSKKRGKKLLWYLRQLEEKEIDQFREYLAMSAFGNSQKLIELLDHVLIKKEADFLDPAELLGQLFPGKPQDREMANYLYFRLAMLLENLLTFLSLVHGSMDAYAMQQFRLEMLHERDLDKYQESAVKAAFRTISPQKGDKELLHEYLIETLDFQHQSLNGGEVSETSLNKVHERLDHFYFLEKLKYACGSLNASLIWGKSASVEMIDAVLRAAEKNPRGLPVVVRAYFHAYKMIEAFSKNSIESEAHYTELAISLESREGISLEEKRDLFTNAVNYCTLRWYQGSTGDAGRLVSLHDLALGQGILFRNDQISPRHFKNIVALMCKVGKVDWAENFIKIYGNQILGDRDGLIRLYNLAVVWLYQGEYRRMVSAMYHKTGNFDDHYFSIGARVYLCRALWALEEWEWLGQNISAFQHFLKRNKVMQEWERKIYLQFTKVLSVTLRIITGNPHQMKQKLHEVGEKLESTPESSVFQWLKSAISARLEAINPQ